MNDQIGLYHKYDIFRRDGTPLSPGFRFVLRPEHDAAAWDALKAYALSTIDPKLSKDLRRWLKNHPRPIPDSA